MTREQAIKILGESLKCFDRKVLETQINSFAALGILKLEEPLSETERLAKALQWSIGSYAHQMLERALEENGLRIVEK